jgi:hypothetical protein
MSPRGSSLTSHNAMNEVGPKESTAKQKEPRNLLLQSPYYMNNCISANAIISIADTGCLDVRVLYFLQLLSVAECFNTFNEKVQNKYTDIE